VPAIADIETNSASVSANERLLAAPIRDVRLSSLRGGAFTFAGQVVKFVLSTGSTMILARILSPADYGLVGMVTSVTALVQLLKDGGLDVATIQRERVTHQEVSNLFWANVVLGVILMLALTALSPLISFLFHDKRLIWITIAHASMLIFSGLAIQHQALIRRKMSFAMLAVIEVVAQLIGVGVGIGMALSGAGYWSLVGMTVATTISTTVATWIALPWVPGRPRRGHSIRPMLTFGRNIVGFNLLNYFIRNADSVLIGWYWGASALGIYQRAYQLLLFPINQINAPMGSVALSAFSRVQQESERLRQYFLASVSIVISTSLPLIIALGIFADDIISLVLGPQWVAAVPVFRCLGVAALVGAAGHPAGWLLMATGRSDRYLRLAVVTCPLVMVAFIAGLKSGPEGVATGYSIACGLAVVPILAYAIRGTTVTLLDIGHAVRHPIIAALVAGAMACAFKWGFRQSLLPPVLAIAGCALYFSVYATVLLMAFGQWRHYRRMFRGFLRS